MAEILIFFVLLFSTLKTADDSKYEKGYRSISLAVFCGAMTFIAFCKIIIF